MAGLETPSRERMYRRWLVCAAILGSLAAGELMARIIEKRDPGRFLLYRYRAYENFFFASGGGGKRFTTVFDPVLGWRNAYPAWEGGVNKSGWRMPEPLPAARRRIVIIGDSFVFGLRVHDYDTISADLERELNGGRDPAGVQVIDMGVRGWGLDQMALAEARAAELHPDVIVIAFIAADVDRCCTDFDFNLAKPYFVMNHGAAQPAGIPVPSPAENYARHRRFLQMLKDRAIALLSRSRLFCLVAQVALQQGRARCENQLAPAILRYASAHVPNGARLMLVHLDGALPAEFDRQVRQFPGFYSIPPLVSRIGRELNVRPERQPDGHPLPGLNRIYARAIAEILRGSDFNARIVNP